MNINSIINIGIAVIIIYATVKLMEYYGIDISVYGVYLSFYVFLYISSIILPKQYPTFE
jgi:hypothetical protein